MVLPETSKIVKNTDNNMALIINSTSAISLAISAATTDSGPVLVAYGEFINLSSITSLILSDKEGQKL